MSRFLGKKQITFYFLFSTLMTELISKNLACLNTFANRGLALKTAHQLSTFSSFYNVGKNCLCQKFESYEFIEQKV